MPEYDESLYAAMRRLEKAGFYATSKTGPLVEAAEQVLTQPPAPLTEAVKGDDIITALNAAIMDIQKAFDLARKDYRYAPYGRKFGDITTDILDLTATIMGVEGK